MWSVKSYVQVFELDIMGKMHEAVKGMLNQCANCGHAERVHQRIISRQNITVPASCNVCRKAGKICKSFKAK
jgi:hypothetical protein